ncbi:MAG TPA: MarR family transcriptional regulator [Candidatus Dormibacteraeota bacterium]|nr:MarR family transcriptional regulator [Candidatus Dormibacteraeota bacterium]
MSSSVQGSATSVEASREQLLQMALTAIDQVAAQHWRKGPGARFARKDPSAGQMHVLMLLHESGPLTVGQLAEILAVSMPSVSSLLDRLEEHGLVERQRTGGDRRLVHVVLTPKGAADAEEAAGFRREAAERVLSQFTDAELQATLQVMGAVQRTISCLDQTR